MSFNDVAKQIVLAYLRSGVEIEPKPREDCEQAAKDDEPVTYEVNVSVACQFEDTAWDYLEDPVYHQEFGSFEEAKKAYYNLGYVDSQSIAERFHKKYPECISFELETSITESGCDFSWADGTEWFDNDNIWSADDE